MRAELSRRRLLSFRCPKTKSGSVGGCGKYYNSLVGTLAESCEELGNVLAALEVVHTQDLIIQKSYSLLFVFSLNVHLLNLLFVWLYLLPSAKRPR